MTLAIPAEQTCGLSSRTAAPGPAEVAECATVVVAGELDLAAAEPLRTRLSSAPAGHREVVADLSAVPFMDCSGLRPLLDAHRYATRIGHRLTVRRPSAAVRRLFQLARSDGPLPVER